MPHDRFFTPVDLAVGTTVTLEKEERHHLQKVMRKKEGDIVEVVNGKGGLADGKVLSSLDLLVENVYELPAHPLDLTLALALTVPNHLEWAIEKGTELGVARFLLFPGDHSQKKEISENQLVRLQKITIAAMKQSGRGTLPPIELFPPIKKWSSFEHPLFFGDFENYKPAQLPKKGKMIFAVGPEAGWSDSECAKLKEIGGQSYLLSTYTLRAETAAIVAAALLLH